MAETNPQEISWSVPVVLHDIPDAGRRYQLAPDGSARARICQVADIDDLPRMVVSFEVVRRGRDAVRVVGHVSATVAQTCVVTLEPILNEVEEEVDVTYTFGSSEADRPALDVEFTGDDPPEPLVDGTLDLGRVATEFLMLGIDPYPRKAGAVFEAPKEGNEEGHPFAALAALKKPEGGTDA
jgi:uncharacterized metal-binding protein YceD (DUF177 family)